MKHISTFTVLLTMVILMIIGVALVPRLDIASEPRKERGSTLTVNYWWQGAAAKVVEQNVTSKIEALVSSVRGVESVSSVSEFGSGHVEIRLKPKADVSAVKFEIASLLRQNSSKLPKGVSYPTLSGGEIDTGRDNDDIQQILSYQVNADMPDEQIRRLTERELKNVIEKIDGVHHVEVTGGAGRYLELTYDARQLANYGLYASDIATAVGNFVGHENVVGTIRVRGSQIFVPLLLSSSFDGSRLETVPVKTIDGKIVYLNNLVSSEIKQRKPDYYYRVNGMNTIYLNVYTDKDASIVRTAGRVKETMDPVINHHDRFGNSRLHFLLVYDLAEKELSEFDTLVLRSALSLAILLLFVWLSSGRSWKYLGIIACTLAANILLAVIAYWILDIRLHPYSMAGITVSLGIIIDSTIVMVDHYSYYRDRKAFIGILTAMLTTVGALVVVFWLPDYLRHDLRDFSVIVIVNLSIALFVALLFAPALVEQSRYRAHGNGYITNARKKVRMTRIYRRYVNLAQHKVWRWVLLALTAGAFAVSLILFIDCMDSNSFKPKEAEKKLNIRAQMPLGGSVHELNDKVSEVEAFLSQFKEIKRYETSVGRWGAQIVVEFKDDALHTGFPYLLENKVIGKVITIGGADWSTWGVSERGFSNSLNLQYRDHRIVIAGYDYDRLYRFAENMCRYMSQNNRIVDIIIQIPNHEHQEDELFMEYDRKALALDSINVRDIHQSLGSMLSESPCEQIELHQKNGKAMKIDAVIRPTDTEDFDLWKLENSYIKIKDRSIRSSDFMKISRREAKNCIPRENQEYILGVAFNIIGSYNYAGRCINQIKDRYNNMFPVGFRCVDSAYEFYEDEGTQYWLIGLIAIIIFFICAILFESLYQALVIILLIPTSMIGLFLTYYVTGVPFGTGGFAAMVMLSGLTVNAGIYIICEYRNCGNYLRAFNHKVIPIFLTIFSTVLGMIPFLIDGADEQPFWYSLAVGTIGGLSFSIIPLVVFLPLVMKVKNHKSPVMTES